ncbi:cation:proton antiporter [Oleidesulfovibrio sp.]|uniref:cation:proton antiporter domain-containing protein n=1 Tax=Oleidesulfovibrio sp. TaxID=2909707 RepID=UPI003A89A816
MELLGNLVLVLGFSVAVVLLAQRLRIPAMVGFLLAGVAAGPHALGMVSDVAAVDVLAEIGVVLLLFTLGMEFSIARLRALLRVALIGGGAQVGVTSLAAGAAAYWLLGFAWNTSIFIGFLVALSSTAIGIRLMRDKGEVETPQGTASLGILIFQDMAVVPMMLLVPVLAGQEGSVAWAIITLIVKTTLVVAGVLFLAVRGVPHLLHYVARWRNRELFLLTLLSICFGVAWGTHAAGLSLALGAFLAGLVISGSEYEHYAASQVLPLHDLFICFFFVSVGMSLDVGLALTNPFTVIGLTALLMLSKAVLVTGAAMLPGLNLASAVMAGGLLCQVGEFSFILARLGNEAGLFSGEAMQLFLAAAVVSMFLTPWAAKYMNKFGRKLRRRGSSALRDNSAVADAEKSDHLVIIGYGPGGRHLAQAARMWNIDYVIIDSNPDTVRDERARGIPIMFGDAASETMLEHAGIEHARAVAVVVSDPVAAHSVTALVRELAPDTQIITRARYLGEYDDMRKAGANEVIPAEMEASVAMVGRVLERFMIGSDELRAFLEGIRAEGYKLDAEELKKRGQYSFLPFMQLRQIYVEEGSAVEGKTLGELHIRRKYRVAVMAVRSNGTVLPVPGAKTPLNVGDEVLLSGCPADLSLVASMFQKDGAPLPAEGDVPEGSACATS